MRGRKSKRTVPIMLFWSRAEQRRFSDAVERFCSLVNDLERILAPKRRKLAAADAAQVLTEAANGQAVRS